MHKHLALAALLLVPAFAGCTSNDSTSDEDPDSDAEGLKVCAKGTTTKGIDVSSWQGHIDWAKVASGGIKFAMIRVGDGDSYLDSQFANNWSGAKAHGVLRGTYHFFRPGDDPVKQADNFVKQIKAHGGLADGDLPPVLDVEVQGVSDATLRKRALTWLQHVEAALGRRPMIYTSPGFWSGLGAGSEFAKYPLWVAHWDTACPSVPSSWSGWKLWQTHDDGHVSGISGNVDTDVFNGSLADLKAFAGGTTTSGGGGSTTTPALASLGGKVSDAPAVGRNPDGRLEVFAVGAKGNLETIFQSSPGGKWSDWYSLGGNFDGRPASINNQDGRLEVFVRNASGAIEHAWQDAPNGKIGAWHTWSGAMSSDPAVAKNHDGRLEVFAVGTDGAVHHAWQTAANGGWSSFASLGKAGGGFLEVSAVRADDDHLRALARGKDGHIYLAAQQSNKWSTWTSLGGSAESAPAVVLAKTGQLALFVRGSNGHLMHTWENSAGGTWASWISLGGTVYEPAAALDLDGRIEVFVRGTDKALWRTRQKEAGGAWEGFTKMGGTMAGGPQAAANKDGRLEVFFRATDSTVHHVWEKSPEVW